MQRPISPDSILNKPEPDLEEEIIFNNWKQSISIGLDHVKQKLGKSNITCGDALNEFWNFSVQTESKALLTPLFYLCIALLQHRRENLEQIQNGIYDALLNYSIEMYEIKLSQ